MLPFLSLKTGLYKYFFNSWKKPPMNKECTLQIQATVINIVFSLNLKLVSFYSVLVCLCLSHPSVTVITPTSES